VGNESEFIAGRNTVREALRAGRSLNKLYIQAEAHGPALQQIIDLALEAGVPFERVRADMLDRLAPGIKHQGVVALAAAVSFSSLEEILKKAEERGEPPFLLVLDELQDPQNVGALLRTADAAGVHGVLIPKRRSCPINATVAKVSAGAVEYVPLVQVGNLVQTLEHLKELGLWIIGADMDGEIFFDARLDGSAALVIGAEGKGLGTLVKKHCDVIVRLPMQGEINSLNASVAGGILMYEMRRQRMLQMRKGK